MPPAAADGSQPTRRGAARRKVTTTAAPGPHTTAAVVHLARTSRPGLSGSSSSAVIVSRQPPTHIITPVVTRLPIRVTAGITAIIEPVIRHRRPNRRQHRTGLRPRLGDLGGRVRVPDDAAANPEMDPASSDRERPDRQREVEVPVAVDAPEAPIEAPRPTGSSSAIRSTAAIFGAPVIDPPGNVARRISAKPTPSRRIPSTVETMCSTPARCRVAISSGQRTLPGLADTGEIVPFEIDDHHVLCTILRRAGQLALGTGRASSLDRRCPQAAAPSRQEQLRGAGHDRPAVTAIRLSVVWLQRCQPGGERCRVAGELRGEVLDEVDLVDVAASDGAPHAADSIGVCRRTPRPLPGTERERAVTVIVVIGANILSRPDGTRSEREGARLRRRRGAAAPDLGGEAVAQIELGDELLPTGCEESAVAQPRFDRLERVCRVVDLDRVPSVHRIRCPAGSPAGADPAAGIDLCNAAGTTLPSV